MKPVPDTTRGVGATLLAATGFSWGFIIVKGVGLPPVTIATWRVAIGAVALGAAVQLLRVGWRPCPPSVLVAGLCFGAHQLLFITASQTTSIAIVTLLQALQPLLVAMVSRRAFAERVPPRLWWSALGAIGGVALVVYANRAAPSRSLLGDGLALLNLVAFTAYFLSAKRARLEGARVLPLTATMLAVALLVVVAPGLAWSRPAMPPEGWQWGLLALMALVPGNGHLLLNWAHPRVGATLASLILALVPILASVWAHLIFDEPYGPLHALGMLVTLVGIEVGRRAELADRLRQAAAPAPPAEARREPSSRAGSAPGP